MLQHFNKALCAFVVLICFYAEAVEYALPDYNFHYTDYNKKDTKVSTLTTELMGDQIDTATGSLSIVQTDFTINVNGGLSFNFARILDQPGEWFLQTGEFGTWSLDIPRIRSSYAKDYNGDHHGAYWAVGKACTTRLNSNPTISHNSGGTYWSWQPDDYWNGDVLHLPNQKSVKLLQGSGVTKYTKDHHKIECIVSKNKPEGFKITDKQGITYYLDVLKTVEDSQTYQLTPTSMTPCREFCEPELPGENVVTYPTQTDVKKYNVFLMASRVEDKFGNFINFNFEGEKLTSITTSDGQTVSLTWKDNLISSVTKASQNWTYGYKNQASKKVLEKVVLPNTQEWNYSHPHLASKFEGPPTTRTFGDSCIAQGYANGVYIDIKHPQGSRAKFHTVGRCTSVINVPKIRIQGLNGEPEHILGHWIKTEHPVISLSKKELEFLGGDSYLWTYAYSQKSGSFTQDDDIYNVTTVTGPDSNITKYYLDRRYGIGFNNLLKKETFNGTTLIQREEYKYSFSKSYGNDYSYIDIKRSDKPFDAQKKDYSADINARLSELKVTNYGTQDTVFTKQINAFNEYDEPSYIKEFNSFSTNEKHTKAQFEHDLSRNALNLVSKVQLSPEAILDDTSNIAYQYSFKTSNFNGVDVKVTDKLTVYGQLKKTYATYHPSGNEKRVNFNANNSFIEFEDYKLNEPQTIKLPKRNEEGSLTISRQIDDNGWIKSITDLNGVTTNYTYDKVGRLTSIDLTNDSTFGNWQDTQFVWDDATNTRTINRCTLNADRTACIDNVSFETVENYDSLLRLKSTTLNDKVNNITRYQNFTYDYRNLPTFTSQVSDSPTESKGVTTVFDALGRKEKVSTSGLGFVTYEYLSGNRIRVTDAGKNTSNDKDSTTTTYQAFGSPSYDVATKIESPEGVTTDINVDVFGLVHSITQSGHGKSVTETRKYDANKQLCLIQRPDIGNTLLKHNALGEVVWQKQGVTNTNCVTTKPANSTTFAYDNLGTIKSVTYPDSTPNVTYGYDNNGNLISIKSGDVEHVYNYNNQNLLEDELLYIDSNNALSVDYEYNALQHRKSITYPDGMYVNFAPNGFGEATQAIYKVGSKEHQVFAKDAVYYPSGQINSFTYGNGVTHKTELDPTTLLPSSITDKRNSTNLVNLSYTYDNNMNVTSITNGVQSTYSLTNLTYDGLDRLISTAGGADIGNSLMTYDAIGNIETYTSKGRNLSYTYDGTTNRLTSVAGISGKYNSIAYDGRGNVKNNGSFDLSYNLANQMKSANGNSYLYDGHNRRVKKTNSDGHAEYSMYSKDGTLLYREKGSASGNGTNYIYLGKKLVAKYGDVAPQTLAESRQHYRPFGETINEPKDDVGYTGHKFDKDINLSYMQARYYDPVIGRFYSNDPVSAIGHFKTGNGPVHGFNRYAYANNNPHKYIDPDGRSSIPGFQLTPYDKGVGPSGTPISDPGLTMLAEATTLKIGVGPGGQAKYNIPGVGKGSVGLSASASVVMSGSDNSSGIEFAADGGAELSDNSGSNVVKLQLGKAEALMVAGQNQTNVKTEGMKAEASLAKGPASANTSGKVKLGAHVGVLKVELEVDTNKL